jgi:hypothetical protein
MIRTLLEGAYDEQDREVALERGSQDGPCPELHRHPKDAVMDIGQSSSRREGVGFPVWRHDVRPSESVNVRSPSATLCPGRAPE